MLWSARLTNIAFCESPGLHLEVHFSVDVGRIDRDMSEPRTYRALNYGMATLNSRFTETRTRQGRNELRGQSSAIWLIDIAFA